MTKVYKKIRNSNGGLSLINLNDLANNIHLQHGFLEEREDHCICFDFGKKEIVVSYRK